MNNDPRLTENPENRHPCTMVWRALLWLGAALTFIRNFICNAVMLLAMLFIFVSYQVASDFMDKAETVITGQLEKTKPEQPPQILYLPLAGQISELPFGQSQFEQMFRQVNDSLSGTQSHELLAIENALQKAVHDDDIKYVLLNLEGMGGISLPAAQRIGDKLKALNDAGKETAVMAVNYSQGAYLIAASAQKIYLDPLGSVGLKGIALSSLYYRDLLNKLSITPYIFRAGHFKSAVEPYTRDSMSPDVKAEYQALAQGLWSDYEKALHSRRVLSRSVILPQAEDFVRSLENYQGDLALMQLELNLADDLKTKEQIFASLSAQYGQSIDERFIPAMLDYRDYLADFGTDQVKTQDKIAVVYGVGAITDIGRTPSDFSADNLAAILSSLAKDLDVKALVLYLNSPGGLASASEEIRRAIELLRTDGVKVVVSVQGMAASGAYWAATASDAIYAAPGSVIGSIGVFSVGFGIHQLLNQVGVSQDGVYTHEFARTPVAEPMGENTRRFYELSVQHSYRTFINLVAQARKLDAKNYVPWAEGQVFLTDKALQLGLIDKVGTLDDAIEAAAELAGGNRDDFNIVHATLPQDQRLSTLESFIFKASARLLPEELNRALFELRFLRDQNSKPSLNQQILMLSAMQQPEL